MKHFGDHKIQLNVDLLRPAKYQLASKHMRMRKGHFAVQMMPVQTRSGGILVANARGSEFRLRPDIGQVIATSPDVPLKPGDYVAVNNSFGVHITGFKCGPYASAYETRIYGTARWTGGPYPAEIPWHNCAIGICNTMKHQVYKMFEEAPMIVSRRKKSTEYESFIFVNSTNDKARIVVPHPEGLPAIFTEVPTSKTLRLTVSSNPLSHAVDIKCEVVSSECLAYVDMLDFKVPFKATGHRVLVELDELHDKTEGGIILPDSATFRHTWCTVLSVGDLVPDVKPGDRILVSAEGLERHTFMLESAELQSRALRLVHEQFILAYQEAEEAA